MGLRGQVCGEGSRMNVLLEDQGGKELEPSISGEPRGAGKCHRWGESAQSQGNKRELVWAHTGWVAGPLPEAHAGLGAARDARLGLSQPPVGSELGRAEWAQRGWGREAAVRWTPWGQCRTGKDTVQRNFPCRVGAWTSVKKI